MVAARELRNVRHGERVSTSLSGSDVLEESVREVGIQGIRGTSQAFRQGARTEACRRERDSSLERSRRASLRPFRWGLEAAQA